MSAADDLRALTAAATPGPWHPDEDYIRGPGGEYVANVNRATNTELVVWLRNHADALADLIAAARAVETAQFSSRPGDLMRSVMGLSDPMTALEAR